MAARRSTRRSGRHRRRGPAALNESRAAAAESRPAAGEHAWWLVLLAIAGGSVLIPLNSTMLAVALPSLMAEFRVGPGTVSWLVTLYLATMALALPAGGSLGDRFGHRRVFIAGVAAFALTSLLGAVARTFPLLIVARVLQAASGAAIGPNAVSLLRALSPEDRRGGRFGLFDMIISTSAAAGPLVGGILVGAFGWRSLFVLAVPIAATSAVVVSAVVAATRPRREERAPLDVPGLLVLSAWLLTLLGAFYTARAGRAWGWWAAAAPVLFVLFVRQELRTRTPAVDVRLFRLRPFAAAVAGVLGATVILHATMIIIPLLTQNLLSASASASGLTLLGISALSAVTAPFGGRLSDLRGRRLPAFLGGLCMALGLSGLWALSGRISTVGVGLLLSVIGVGFGLGGAPRQVSAVESVPPASTGMAAAAYYTSRYIGGVIGASLAGALLGDALTPAIVARAFAVLALVALGVSAVSLGLRGRS